MVDICVWNEDKNNMTELKINQSWQEVIEFLEQSSYYWQDMTEDDYLEQGEPQYLYIQ